VQPGGLYQQKNFNDTIGNRTHDLPACNKLMGRSIVLVYFTKISLLDRITGTFHVMSSCISVIVVVILPAAQVRISCICFCVCLCVCACVCVCVCVQG
jgi:hypothetical protein